MNQILDILGSVGFNWHVALANFINFLIIFFLLNKFFFGKLGATIKQRHELIERGLSQASDAEKALLRAHDEERSIIKQAQKESQSIIASAEVQASSRAETIIGEAEKVAQAKADHIAHKEATLASGVEKAFMEKAPRLVAALYAKTLRTEMTQEANDSLIARMK